MAFPIAGRRGGVVGTILLETIAEKRGFLFDRQEKFIVVEAVGSVGNAEGVFQGAEGIAQRFQRVRQIP
jgi:hypothetical protein